jgi:hypothetical protein
LYPKTLYYAGRVQDLNTLDAASVRLDTVLGRLASRYRSMSESKLLGRLPDGRSRAAAGHELASLIALAAQGVEDRSRPLPPAWRALPFEGPLVVGDQIGVTGHDLLAACGRLGERPASTAVWAPPGVRCDRAGVGTILARVLGAAEDLTTAV